MLSHIQVVSSSCHLGGLYLPVSWRKAVLYNQFGSTGCEQKKHVTLHLIASGILCQNPQNNFSEPKECSFVQSDWPSRVWKGFMEKMVFELLLQDAQEFDGNMSQETSKMRKEHPWTHKVMEVMIHSKDSQKRSVARLWEQWFGFVGDKTGICISRPVYQSGKGQSTQVVELKGVE